jgi:hypothetical protein
MTDHQRLYRRLLRLYPAAFRDEYGEEMPRLFAEQLWDARTSGGRKAIAGLWARTLLDLASTAPRQHLERATRMPQPADGSAVALVERRRQHRSRRVFVGSIPLWIFLAGRLSSGSKDRLLEKPPEMLGLPLGIVLIGLGLLLMTAGVVALRLTSSSRSAALAVLFFIAPATVLVVAAPWIIDRLSRLIT